MTTWVCSECTYENSFYDAVCVMCEQGYRLFSANDDESKLKQIEASVIDNSSTETNENENNMSGRQYHLTFH